MKSRSFAFTALLALPVSASLVRPLGDELPQEARGALEDAAIDEPRVRLIELAFDSASALPVDPYIKKRSRAQERVVAACLELNQPARALSLTEGIADWRSGSCLADLALYCARNGKGELVDDLLDRALVAAETSDDWRRDRVRAKVASVHAWLGHEREALELEDGLADSETGKVEAVRAMVVDEERFDEQIATLDVLGATPNFDVARNALDATAELYDRFYAHAERRKIAEERIRIYWKAVPTQVRIDVLAKLAESSLGHDDLAKALELVDEAQALFEGTTWMNEDEIPLWARLGALRFRCGDEERGKSQIDKARAIFEREREKIYDVFRAKALRPVAEACHAIGDGEAASAVYRQAVDQGALNPNARPRAEDLSATCLSMARVGFVPDAKLWARMLEVRSGLAAPW